MSAPALSLAPEPHADTEQRLSEAQLAEKMKRHVQTIRRWRREGVLPCHKRGKTIWFTPEDIETFERRSAVDHGRRPR